MLDNDVTAFVYNVLLTRLLIEILMTKIFCGNIGVKF